MAAILDDLKGVPVGRMGGQIDYQGAIRVINGGATKAQNVRFLLDTVGTRYGTEITMSNPESGEDVTGLDCLTVLGQLNLGEVPVVFDSEGNLWQESPSGSGTLVPLAPPVSLPENAYMGSTKGQNNLYMCFRLGNTGKGLALLYNGPNQQVTPISQNPIGAIWTPNRDYLVGDVVRTSQNPSRWFRCIMAGTAGNVEPSWPVLDGYLSPGPAAANIISAVVVPGVHGNQAILTVSSVIGFTLGGSIVIVGNSNADFNATWTITVIGTNQIRFAPGVSLKLGETGSGGTVTQASGTGVVSDPAQVTDPNGPSQWVEWTPGAAQFLPAPELPEYIASIQGQAGAPVGSIPSGQDVYVCFAYQNANGESQWTTPIRYSNTAADDVLEVFFQIQNEVPGPGPTPPGFGVAGYGGPRMPQWLISVLGLSDPQISWPNLNCLNVYAATVATGNPAPIAYYAIASGAPVYEPVVISSVPTSGSTFQPRSSPTAAFTKLPFVGQGGARYLAVERLDVNGSLVPIDPGSPLLVNFLSSIAASGQANVLFIQRSNNIVTCTVDQLAGFAQGAQVVINGVADPSFDGSFTLTGVSPNQFGGATLIWAQSANNAASSGGTATSASASSSFVIPQDLIATISRVSDVVTAVVNSLAGLAVGVVISVAGVAPTSTTWDGTWTITAIVPNLGGGGTVTWSQTAGNDSSTGGTISPTGAGVGTNAAQPITQIWRSEIPAAPGYVLCLFAGDGTPSQPPPGFITGAQITIAGSSDPSLDGTFTLTGVAQNTGSDGGWEAQWQQAGAATTGNGGTATLITGAPPALGQGNLKAVTRASNVVTATLDTVAGFAAGAQVQVAGVLDPTYDGVFTIVSVNTGTDQLTWAQPGPNSSSSGGNVVQNSGGAQQPTPVAILPPGGPFIAQDIAAYSVQGAQQGGPFNYVSEQDPVTPFSATILSIGAINGTVTALLSSTSGIQAGSTVEISGTPNGWFDGVFVLAEVTGNTIEYAGVGPGTGYSGGTLTVVPTLPTDALGQNAPLGIGNINRTAAGIVSAQLPDVSNVEAGQRIAVSLVSDFSFDGEFIVTSVQQFPDVLSGVVTWQSEDLTPSASNGGYLVGLPGIITNFTDVFLASSAEVTAELQALPAPPTPSDLWFIEQFDMMAYIDNVSYPSAVVFGNPGDPANVAGSSGDPNNPGSNILSVNSNSGSRTVCVREIKDGPVICLKTDGGYQISASAVYPSQWTPTERWDKFGPPCPGLVAVGPDFLVFVHETGVYAYVLGSSGLIWVTETISGDGTWSRVNWAAAVNVGWIEVQSDTREVHVGLPFDGSDVVNYKLTISYFGGWEQPETLNRYGKLITPRNCIKLSVDPFLCTIGKVVERMLTGVDSRITERQMLWGLPGSILSPSGTPQPISLASRQSGTVTLTLPLGGSLTDDTVLVAGVQDPSFNGSFAGAVFSTDGISDYCTYAQVGLDSNSGGGTVVLAISQLQVAMTVPDHYDDYGNGIDMQYSPWLWQNPPRMIKAPGYRASLKGNGVAYITPCTDDTTQVFQSQQITLVNPKVAQQFERGIRVPDNEYIGLVISNGAAPGAWVEIHHLELCIAEMATRRG